MLVSGWGATVSSGKREGPVGRWNLPFNGQCYSPLLLSKDPTAAPALRSSRLTSGVGALETSAAPW